MSRYVPRRYYGARKPAYPYRFQSTGDEATDEESRQEFEQREQGGKRDGIDDYGGIECVLSVDTVEKSNSSQRSADTFILEDRGYHPTHKREGFGSSYADEASVVSAWSRSSAVKPLFGSDAGSSSTVASSKSRSRRRLSLRGDNPYKAAKRGDLQSIKQFYQSGTVDFSNPDGHGKLPLHYACQSGALADISIVPYLLWVTDINEDSCVEQYEDYAINRDVLQILKEYEQGGVEAISKYDDDIPSYTASKFGSLSYRDKSRVYSPGRKLEKVRMLDVSWLLLKLEMIF